MNDNVNKDGLRYPSIDELLEKIDSKYKLAFTAAKRAKIIKEEEYTSMEDDSMCHTAVGQALEEILNDKVEVEFLDTAEDAKPQNTFGSMDISIDTSDADDESSITELEEE